MWKVTVTILLFAEILFAREPPPSLGDIRIKYPILTDGTVYGEAQVYFTDGFLAPTWSSLCSGRFLMNESNVFCTQLGYDKSFLIVSKPSNGTDPIWIKELNCMSGSLPHIFHCNYTIKSNTDDCETQNGNNDVVYVSCSSRKTNNQNTNNPPYIGEVSLCPPDIDSQSNRYLTQSISFGIVSLNFYNKWGPLAFNSDGKAVPEVITHYRGNLICQQLGYQQVIPGSIQTLSSYQTSDYSFTQCFSDSGSGGVVVKDAWITTQDLTCQSASYKDEVCTSTLDDPCFSCCFQHPPPKVNKILPRGNFIVLQCMYDVYNENYVPFGNQSSCSFEDERVGKNIIMYRKICAAGSYGSKSYSKGYYISTIVFATFFASVAIIFVACAVCACCCCCMDEMNKKKEYVYGRMDPNGEK